MPTIRRLPPELASRIAAGEVIERPASLLKELIENALDAGAASVRVEVSGAGRAALRVNDDGCGMSAEDCVLALERHATSKIAALDDLERLSTFGFRGEALYAAAAVSRLSLSSCPRRAAEGFRVESEGGKLARSGPAAAVAGTTVEARDLFYNTPARLKFLKSDAYERSRLASVLEEAALANPEVRFDYKSEGRQLLHFAAETSPDPLERQRRRCAAVLGPELSEDLLPVLGDRPGYRLRLWLGAPDRLASTRRFQHWFVNRRPIDSRLLQQALYRAYGERRPREKHPVCVAYLELPPDAFDVNVHPGKREVRFHKERDLFELVCGLAAAALASRRPEPILLERGEGAGTPSLLADAPRPSESGERFPRFQEQTLALSSRPAEMVVADGLAQAWWTPPYRFLGQIERSYLLFEARGGLFLLDQHAAAERILFERFLAELEDGGARSQRLMLPLPIELTASSLQAVLEHSEELARMGFQVEPYGKATLHVLSTPTLFADIADLKGLVHRLLESYADPARAERDVAHHAVATIACKAAVKAHDPLGEKEALALLEQLKQCKDGTCCPHGRRAMLALSRDELARRFQRPGAPPL